MWSIFGSIAMCATVLTAFGFAGALHPAGDSFAVLRLPLAAVFAVAVLGAPIAWRLRAGLFAVAVTVIWSILPYEQNRERSDYDYVLYQQNMLFARTERDLWIEAVRAAGADFVTLQEVSRDNRVVLAALAGALPTQVYCEFASVGGVAVLSRFERVEGSAICADHDGLAAVQVETPKGPVWLVSIHLHWPWPHGQAAQVARLTPILERLDGPVIIGGDFNAVAWSYTVAEIARASSADLIGPHWPTFHVKGVPIGIDHVLSGGIFDHNVFVVPKLGSDHHGVIAWIKFVS